MGFAPLPLSEEDLHGFVDNELDDERREAVLTHLAHTPADAVRVDAWRQQNILLRAAFSQVALEQVPLSLSCSFTPRLISLPSFGGAGSAARQVHSRRLQQRSLVFAVAAFIAGICITLAANLSLSHYKVQATASAMPPSSVAVIAASDLRGQADATQPATPGAIEPALILIPILEKEGITLTRGELRGPADHLAHCLNFADRTRTPIVLCVSAAQFPTTGEFRSVSASAGNVVYWREAASIYALTAPMEHARLITLAQRLHARLAAQYPQ